MSINMQLYLGGVLKGAHQTRQRHLMQADVIQLAIETRWKRDHPERWQVKHLRWFLHEQLKTASPDTRYRYWLTTRVLVQRLNKTNDWLPHLSGPWTQKPKRDKA